MKFVLVLCLYLSSFILFSLSGLDQKHYWLWRVPKKLNNPQHNYGGEGIRNEFPTYYAVCVCVCVCVCVSKR